MKIGIVIPFHLKGEFINPAYARVFSYYDHIPYTLHLCGSEGDLSETFARTHAPCAKYFEVPQEDVCISSSGSDTLRKKFNDSLATLGSGFHWYCLAGADDIVPLDFYNWLAGQHYTVPTMAGVDGRDPLYIHNLVDGDKFRVKLTYSVKLLPGVNAFNQQGMAASGYRPYQLRGCETGAEQLFKKIGSIQRGPGHVLMLKGQDCLNGVAKIKARHGTHRLTEDELNLVASYE